MTLKRRSLLPAVPAGLLLGAQARSANATPAVIGTWRTLSFYE